jgi:hypothetical protein
MTIALAFSRCSFKPIVVRSLMVGALSTAGVLLGIVPTLDTATVEVTFEQAAYAQNGPQFSDRDLENYVRAAEQLEIRRQRVVEEIKGIVGYVPAIRCDVPSSLDELPSGARERAVSYCNWAIGIVEENDLRIDQFNAIMSASQSNSDLAQRIRCIQQPSDACGQ